MKVIFNQSSLVFAQTASLEVTISSVAGDPLGKVVSFATNAENARQMVVHRQQVQHNMWSHLLSITRRLSKYSQ